MPTKLSLLKAAMRAGNWEEALRIAARFPQLGEHKAAIKRAHEAFHNPGFFAQLGYNTEALKKAGIAALKARYLM